MASTTTTSSSSSLATSYTPVVDEDYINKIYDNNLTSQKSTLESNYNTNISNLDAEKEKAQKETDTNLNKTYVENAKANKNYNEVQNAYGLSSGAMGQARLASDNQLQADLTALRNTQAAADAEVERQRSILAQEYSSAIAKAQADNDMERAQALYEAAQADEERLYKEYLTTEQRAYDEAQAEKDQQQAYKEAAAEMMAAVGDYSLYKELYGLTDAQVQALLVANGFASSGGGGGDSGSSYSGSGSGSSDRTSASDSSSSSSNSSASSNALYNLSNSLSGSNRSATQSGNLTTTSLLNALSRSSSSSTKKQGLPSR